MEIYRDILALKGLIKWLQQAQYAEYTENTAQSS